MASMINSYAVGLSLNTEGVAKGGRMARSEFAALNRVMREVQTPAERITRQINLVEKAMAAGVDDTAKLAQAQQRLKQRLDETTAAAQKQSSLMPKLSQGMQMAGAAGVNVGGVPGIGGVALAGGPGMVAAGVLGGIAVQSARLSMELEKTNAKYRTLLGSAAAGEDFNRRLRALAGQTPLDLRGVQDAASTLLAFNVAGDQVIPTLRMLGDVTAGDNERFKSMALAFGQMSSAGRMMGQDLLQMIAAGFNPLQEISLMTGESMIDLKKRMEDGAISSQEVAAAFRHATEEGGRFNGLMQEMANTSAGQLEMAMSNLTEAGYELGNALAPATKQLAELAKTGTEWAKRPAEGFGMIAGYANDVLKGDFSFSGAIAFQDEIKQRRDFEAWRKEHGAESDRRLAERAKQIEAEEKKRQEALKQKAEQEKRAEADRKAAAKVDADALKKKHDAEQKMIREQERAQEKARREQERASRAAEQERARQAEARRQKYEEEQRYRETYQSEGLQSTDARSADAYAKLVEFERRKIDASKGNEAERKMLDLQRQHLIAAQDLVRETREIRKSGVVLMGVG